MKFYMTVDKTIYLSAFQGPFMWSVNQGLLKRKKPLYLGREWAMDSGGFSELRIHGKYTYTPKQYVEAVERLQPDLFFTMDWMCEPSILRKTGLTVERHQELTLGYTIEIMDLIERTPLMDKFATVIQGWTVDDYLSHIDFIGEQIGSTPIMGIGSICRRNSQREIMRIIRACRQWTHGSIKLHGFGVKMSLLKYPYGPELAETLHSADSAAWGWMDGCWQVNARRKLPYIRKYAAKVNHLIERWGTQKKLGACA